ncbi:MAG: hypothetical protein R3Y56_07740 [Akkermansia sp.]
MSDILTTSTKAEKRALQLATFLMEDEGLQDYMMTDVEGAPQLFWTSAQVPAITALMNSYKGAIIPWHPTLEPVFTDGNGGETIMWVRCPIVVAVHSILGADAMPACHRLATAVLRRGQMLAGDLQYQGDPPVVDYVGTVDLSTLGENLPKVLAQMIQFSFKHYNR